MLKLPEDAQTAFFEWRNDLFQIRNDLPAQVQGFIPKLVGYALRFAGVLYLMHRFSQVQKREIFSRDFIQKGIRLSEFYLGHIICAIEALTGNAPHLLCYWKAPLLLHQCKETGAHGMG